MLIVLITYSNDGRKGHVGGANSHLSQSFSSITLQVGNCDIIHCIIFTFPTIKPLTKILFFLNYIFFYIYQLGCIAFFAITLPCTNIHQHSNERTIQVHVR